MKRFLLLVTTVWIIAVVGVSLASAAAAAGAQQRSAAAKGGKKPPPDAATVLTFLLELADRVDIDGNPTDTLRSDGRVRLDPTVDNEPPIGIPDFDADMDLIGDLTDPLGGIGPIFY